MTFFGPKYIVFYEIMPKWQYYLNYKINNKYAFKNIFMTGYFNFTFGIQFFLFQKNISDGFWLKTSFTVSRMTVSGSKLLSLCRD